MGRGESLRSRSLGPPITGGLAGGSLVPVLPWRLVADVITWLSGVLRGAGVLVEWLRGVLDVLAVGFIVLQSVSGSPRLGLTLAWLLIGWLIYQYAHLLYPAEFRTVVEFKGFRALTALGTLYFGIVVAGGIAPQAIPVQPLRAVVAGSRVLPGTVILALLCGVVAGSLAFLSYLTYVSRARSVSSDPVADLRSVYLSMVSDESQLNRYDSSSGSLPAFWTRVEWASTGIFLVIPCIAMGVVGVVLNAFYPLPEAALFVGLVIIRVAPESMRGRREVSVYELDLRLLDSLSASIRNPKGSTMAIFTVFGAMMSSGAFLFGALYFYRSTIAASWNVERRPFDQFAVLELTTHALVLLAILVMGVYSLVHWLRQAERLGPYAQYWETAWADKSADETLPILRPPARLPGLLVPAHLPVLAVVAPNAVWSIVDPVLREGWILLAVVSLVAMGWAVTVGLRHSGQPLEAESRYLLATVVVQFLSYTTMYGLVLRTRRVLGPSETLQFGALVVSISLSLVLVYYVPEVQTWKAQQDGLRKFAADVPALALMLVGIWVYELLSQVVQGGAVQTVQLLVVGLAVALVLNTAVDIRTGRER